MGASHPNRRQFLTTAAAGMGGFVLPGIAASAAADKEPSASDPACWAQFLGPRRDNATTETGLNLDWKAKAPATVWKVALGDGLSSMAIIGDRIFTMTKRGAKDIVVCLDTKKGEEKWACDGAESYLDKQRQGAGPRSTPTYHKGKLYCLFPRGDLLCVQASDGKELWRKNIFKDTDAKERFGDTYYWGMSGSPLVEGDVVITHPGGDKDNSIVAFSLDKGEKVWSVGADPAGYASPIAITAAGKRQIVMYTGRAAVGLDPAKGTQLWRYVMGNKFDCNCATPLWVDDLLFLSSAYGVGAAALEIGKDGDTLTAKAKWRNKNLMNQFTTSVIHQGHVYGCHGDLGAVFLRCLDLKSGESKWEDRRPGKCSLLLMEGHIVAVSESGKVRLIEANPKEYVVKGEMEVMSYKTWAAPALLDKKLYLRDDKHLVCLDVAKG